MKKVFTVLLFVLLPLVITLFSKSHTVYGQTKDCKVSFGERTKNMYGSSGAKVAYSDSENKFVVNFEAESADNFPIVWFNLGFSAPCKNNQLTYTVTQAGKQVSSSNLTVVDQIHNIKFKPGLDVCKYVGENGVFEHYWVCDNLKFNVKLGSIVYETLEVKVRIYTHNKTFNDNYSKHTSSEILFDGQGEISDTSKCSIKEFTIKPSSVMGTFGGDPLFIADTTGTISTDQYYRGTLETENCTGTSVAFSASVFKSGSSDLFSGKVPITKLVHYMDFSPAGLDLAKYCNEDTKKDNVVYYKCSLMYVIKSDGDFFSTSNDGLKFYVKLPANTPPQLNGSSIIGSDIKGVNLGTFGSTGIKEGFSWDPCYNPDNKEMITYPDMTNSELGKPVAVSKLKPDQIAAGYDECYTLLSNLPIKMTDEKDPVSSKIGYAPGRDKEGKLIPGLFKTVIVGRFFIGDFIVYLFKLLVGISALVAVAVLIYIGIGIASNRENPFKLQVLKQWLTRVFIAIAIILGSYLILGIIDPKLTDFNFGVGNNFTLSSYNFPPVALSPSQGTITGGYTGGASTSTLPLSDEVYLIAKAAEAKTGVKAASIMAIFNQESDGGINVGGCNIPGKPDYTQLMPNPESNSWHKTDVAMYLSIMKSLNRSPNNQPLSCRLGDGYGGAMGPMQFLPSVWYSLIPQIAAATGHNPPDPWNLTDAITAASILLKNNGGVNDLYNAACKYYSGRACDNKTSNKNKFYGEEVVAEAMRLQKLIDAKTK